MNYLSKKRNSIDKCNLCGEMKPLTWDHVPPRSLLIEPNTYVNQLFKKNELPSLKSHMSHFQSGIKFRSVCANCNNVLIGKNDQALTGFVGEVKNLIEVYYNASAAGIVFPQTIIVKAKINRVLRALCGHFLAMKPFYDDQTIIDNYMRSFLLDESCVFNRWHLYCWFYPFSTIQLVRDVKAYGYRNNTHPKGVCSIISFYPLSFLISDCEESDCQVDEIGKYATRNIDDTAQIELHFGSIYYANSKIIKEFRWPVDISNDENGAAAVKAYSNSLKWAILGVSRSKIHIF